MKLFLYTIIFSLFLSIAHAQDTVGYARWQLNFGNGVPRLTRLPEGIDQQLSKTGQIILSYNIHLAKKHFYLSVGAGYEESRYIADGYFTLINGAYNFSVTPDNYKMHELNMRSLHFPVLLRVVSFRSSVLSFGPYVNYLLDADSKYKIGTQKFTMDAPVENKFSAGLKLDQEFVLFPGRKRAFTQVMGLGLQYQLTNNLSNSRSFKPFMGYIKIGFALW